MRPGIHIVTACYNSEATIRDTLESVLAQIDLVTSYVIIDGASTDSTRKIIEEYCDAFEGRLHLVSEPDDGIYDAMNKGISRCLDIADDMDLIATLNADDRYVEGALCTIAEKAEALLEVDVLYGDTELIDRSGARLGVTRPSAPRLTLRLSADGMPIEHPAMFVRARTYRRFGLYDTSYRIAADYEFVLRMLDASVAACHVPAVITQFRMGGTSTTDETASFKEAIRVRLAHGANPVWEWSRYYKRRFFGLIFRGVRWIPGIAGLQARFGSSARHGRGGSGV